MKRNTFYNIRLSTFICNIYFDNVPCNEVVDLNYDSGVLLEDIFSTL